MPGRLEAEMCLTPVVLHLLEHATVCVYMCLSVLEHGSNADIHDTMYLLMTLFSSWFKPFYSQGAVCPSRITTVMPAMKKAMKKKVSFAVAGDAQASKVAMKSMKAAKAKAMKAKAPMKKKKGGASSSSSSKQTPQTRKSALKKPGQSSSKKQKVDDAALKDQAAAEELAEERKQTGGQTASSSKTEPEGRHLKKGPINLGDLKGSKTSIDLKLEEYRKQDDETASLTLSHAESKQAYGRLQWARNKDPTGAANQAWREALAAPPGQKQAAKMQVMKAWVLDPSWGQRFLSVSKSLTSSKGFRATEKPQTWKELSQKYTEEELELLLDSGAITTCPHSKNSTLTMYIDHGTSVSLQCNAVI